MSTTTRSDSFIGYSRWFDNHQPLIPGDGTHIAPGIDDHAPLRQFQIGSKHLFFQFFKHISTSKNTLPGRAGYMLLQLSQRFCSLKRNSSLSQWIPYFLMTQARSSGNVT